jgi:hypothetical protein
MAITKKKWSTRANALGSSGAFHALASCTYQYSTNINLETSGFVGAWITVRCYFDSTDHDNVRVGVLTAQTTVGTVGSSHYDLTEIFSQDIARLATKPTAGATDYNQISFPVYDAPHVKVRVRALTTADSHTAWVYHKRFRYVSTGAN